MINFPSNPTTGQQHTYQNKTWSWTGVAWTRVDQAPKSAYDIAVLEGFVGTQEQWIDSLVGAVGPQGPIGLPGLNNTITTLEELAELDTNTVSAIVDGALFTWTLGDYLTVVDNIDYIASTSIPSTTGVWIRQGSEQLRKLGAFGGNIIPNDQTPKQALQSLELAIETKATAAALGVLATAENLGSFTSPLINDNGSVKTALESIGTNLAASSGSSNIGFLQSGTGAIARTLETKARELAVSVKDFGAVGDGTTDDSAAIRAADLACGQTRPLYFPMGIYRVTQDGSNGWCLRKFSSNRWFGDGMGRSVIYPDPAIPNTCDTVREIASTLFENRGGGANDLFIGNPFNGTRAGRHGWHVDTTIVNVPLQINGNVYFRIATGFPVELVNEAYGFCHTNDVGNSEGGMYATLMSDCVLAGGFAFKKTGDSIWLQNLRTTGTYPNLIDQVVNPNGPGNTFTIRSGNFTNSGGILKITNMPGGTITGINTENFVAGASGNNGGCAIWLKAPDVWSNSITYNTGDLVTVGLTSYRAVPKFTAGDPGAEPPVQPALIPNINKNPTVGTITPPDIHKESDYWVAYDPFENLVLENSLLSVAGSFDGFTVVRIGTGDHVTFRNNRMGVGLASKTAFTVGAAATNTKLTNNTFPNLQVSDWLSVETAGQSIDFDSYGTVTQLVSKGEPVTLHRASGAITMHAANLAAGTASGFTLINQLIGPNDIVLVQQKGGATVNAYDITVDIVGTGDCRINVRNRSAGDLAEALIISFSIIKARV